MKRVVNKSYSISKDGYCLESEVKQLFNNLMTLEKINPKLTNKIIKGIRSI